MSNTADRLQCLCFACFFGGGIILHLAGKSMGEETAVIVAAVGFVAAIGKIAVCCAIGDDTHE